MVESILCLSSFIAISLVQMQQNEDTIKQQQNEIEDLKRKLRLKDEAEAKVISSHSLFHGYQLTLELLAER